MIALTIPTRAHSSYQNMNNAIASLTGTEHTQKIKQKTMKEMCFGTSCGSRKAGLICFQMD